MRHRDLVLCGLGTAPRCLSRFSRNETMWTRPSLSIAWDFGAMDHRRAAPLRTVRFLDGYRTGMKMSLRLIVVGVCALTAAVLSYALGLAQTGTRAGITALLLTGSGLALLNQNGRHAAHRQLTCPATEVTHRG